MVINATTLGTVSVIISPVTRPSAKWEKEYNMEKLMIFVAMSIGAFNVFAQEYSIVSRKVYVNKVELVSVSDLQTTKDILSGSKIFLVKVHYCGFDKVTIPRFQNSKVTRKEGAILGGTWSIYLEKSIELVSDVKSYKNIARADVCYENSQEFEFKCPIRPGYEGAGCEFKVNGEYSIYIENFESGTNTMLGYSSASN